MLSCPDGPGVGLAVCGELGAPAHQMANLVSRPFAVTPWERSCLGCDLASVGERDCFLGRCSHTVRVGQIFLRNSRGGPTVLTIASVLLLAGNCPGHGFAIAPVTGAEPGERLAAQ